MRGLVTGNAEKARGRLVELLAWEHAYINTKHEDFVTFEAATSEATRRFTAHASQFGSKA